MTIENLGWFMLGAGSVILGLLAVLLIPAIIRLMKARRKFRYYVESLKGFSDKLAQMKKADEERSREISELTFRDKSGSLCTVKIIIDHRLDQNLTEEDKQRMVAMVNRGDANAGTLDDIISGATCEESEMKKVQQFVFSGHAAMVMRQQGIEPDEVVRKMLKASGRIA